MREWDPRAGEEIAILPGHENIVSSVDFHPAVSFQPRQRAAKRGPQEEPAPREASL